MDSKAPSNMERQLDSPDKRIKAELISLLLRVPPYMTSAILRLNDCCQLPLLLIPIN